MRDGRLSPCGILGGPKSRSPWGAQSGLLPVLLLSLLLGLVGWAQPAAAQQDLGGLELTPEVSRQLSQLQTTWQSWARHFAAGDAAAADAEIERLLLLADRLGAERLPDLAAAASAEAIQSAREGNLDAAEQALDAAEALDAGRPEVAFARARVAFRARDVGTAVTSLVKGYTAIFQAERPRRLFLANGALWLLYSLLAAAAAFVALMMTTRGSSLFYDIARLYSPPLPRLPADLLTLALLVWPVVLPHGPFWLLLYWSVLLWGYGSTSERAMLLLGWLLLGASPVLLVQQQRAVQASLVPPARLLDNLESGSLYGGLFSDLEVMRSMLPDSPGVTEVVADLHRRLGQWDHARALYVELSQDPELENAVTAAAYTNLGVYHQERGDSDTAANYYRRAIDADPTLAEAHYDLAQSQAQLYEFSESHETMARAKALEPQSVEEWNRETGGDGKSAITVDGGLRRAESLRADLAALWRPASTRLTASRLWRQFRALSLSLGLLLLALALDQVRRQVTFKSLAYDPGTFSAFDRRWLRAIVPGLESSRRENGVLAYLGLLLPIALLMAVLLRHYGYRLPLAYQPPPSVAWTLCGVALGVLYGFRFASARSEW